ncbi:MAG: hypothetical protein JO219_00705 [Candidatus Eremiobacteraeota bacterium]|nr:hypothetical protein [Candidatus Eremiobacteraeota bacterium]
MKIVEIRPAPSPTEAAAIEAALADIARAKALDRPDAMRSKWLDAARAEALDDGIR